jgi:hypothetical protein
MANSTTTIATTIYNDDVISIDDDVLNSTMSSVVGATGSSGYITSGVTGSTFNWHGTGVNTWNTTYSVTGNTTISGNLGIGAGSYNGTYTIPKPKLSLDIDGEVPIISTEKNKINVDELAEMITLMKSLLVAVASDEEFAKRNPALAEAAHDMLIKKLKG